MLQAIETKYLGPTNYRGSRIVAKAWAGKITDHWDHAGNIEANHCRAAKLLAVEKGWSGVYIGGGMAKGSGFCFVRLEGSFTYGWCLANLTGKEGEDWFYIASVKPVKPC